MAVLGRFHRFFPLIMPVSSLCTGETPLLASPVLVLQKNDVSLNEKNFNTFIRFGIVVYAGV